MSNHMSNRATIAIVIYMMVQAVVSGIGGILVIGDGPRHRVPRH